MSPTEVLALVARAEAEGLQLVVYIRPVRPLTPCEEDVLLVLQDAPRPLTSFRVLGLLEGRKLLHGESTIRRALAHLVAIGRLKNNRQPPRGYLLSDH